MQSSAAADAESSAAAVAQILNSPLGWAEFGCGVQDTGRVHNKQRLW